jgi:hypothetical protein
MIYFRKLFFTIVFLIGLCSSQTCTINIPDDPLTAKGLATPYTYEGCKMADTPSFVQGAILDLETGKIFAYSPLVIDKDTEPLAPPVVPVLPRKRVVGLWFGSNGDTLIMKGGAKGNCVNGLKDSPFGQFGYCNAKAFFDAAKGKVVIPDVGVSIDGLPCPTTLDFMVVDQDPSDNVQTTYLLKGNLVAQNTAANRAKFADATILRNPSDEALLSNFIAPILGCKVPTVPDLADNNAQVSLLALNELQATRQAGVRALLPANNPMVLVGDQQSLEKLNLYRAGINQEPAKSLQEASGREFCKNLLNIGAFRLQMDMGFLAAGPSADPAAANSLFTFLANRFSNSFIQLKCADFGFNNPVFLTVNDGITRFAFYMNMMVQ